MSKRLLAATRLNGPCKLRNPRQVPAVTDSTLTTFSSAEAGAPILPVEWAGALTEAHSEKTETHYRQFNLVSACRCAFAFRITLQGS